MSTQLRLVETPGKPRRRSQRRARPVRAGRARRARWDTDWRLDATARQVGRQGVAAARAALARADRPQAPLPKAS